MLKAQHVVCPATCSTTCGSTTLITIPFSVYDFFGILSAGFIFLAAWDYAFARHWMLQDHLSLVASFFWLAAAYITGHIIANLAGFILEEHAVRRWLRSPEETLFGSEHLTDWWRWLFPGHHRPLPHEIRQRVLEKAADAGFKEPGRALFFHCHPIVMRVQVTRERLDTFRNVYGFCRNACMALILATLVLLVGAIGHLTVGTATGAAIWWAILGAFIAAIGMFYRYLKSFREYTVEVFRVYPEAD